MMDVSFFLRLLITSLITNTLQMYHLPVTALKDKVFSQANVFSVLISKALS